MRIESAAAAVVNGGYSKDLMLICLNEVCGSCNLVIVNFLGDFYFGCMLIRTIFNHIYLEEMKSDSFKRHKCIKGFPYQPGF